MDLRTGARILETRLHHRASAVLVLALSEGAGSLRPPILGRFPREMLNEEIWKETHANGGEATPGSDLAEREPD